MNKLHAMYVIFSYLVGFVLFCLLMDIFRFEKIIFETLQDTTEEMNSLRVNEESQEIISQSIYLFSK